MINKRVLSVLLKNKEVNNAGWLIGGKVIQMALSFVVGVFTAKYLGPSNYGLINYGLAYATFFTAFCNLGINSILVKEFIDKPSEAGTVLGTTIVLRIITSVLSGCIIAVISLFVDNGEPVTIIVAVLCSVSLVFQCGEVFNYWFQAIYMAKRTSVASLIAYSLTSIYKILLLLFNADIKWFALATSVDYLIYAIIIFLFYRKHNGPRLRVSFDKGKYLLKQSYHYILAAVMTALYMQTDKIMLKQMLSEEEVGYYSVASTICSLWVFVLMAIIDSMYPTIIHLFRNGEIKNFDRKNRQLYCIVFYLSCFVSLGFLVFGRYIIKFLFGQPYEPAVNPLRILTWYTAFSYLGVARNAWLICMDAQKYLKYLYIGAAFINIAMNYIMIPVYGASGAAMASLITQIFTSIILPLFIKDTRKNSVLMLEAIIFRGVK